MARASFGRSGVYGATIHTLITLERGYLQTRLTTDEGETIEKDIDMGRWREAIGPAISLLQSFGGGEAFVHHRPSDLLP